MADSKKIDPQAYVTLLGALKKYEEDLCINMETMKQAADLCSESMEEDELSTRYVSQLKEALKGYTQTLKIVEEVHKVIQEDYKKIENM